MKALLLVVSLSTIAVTLACGARDAEKTSTPDTYQTRGSQGDISFRLTPRRATPGRLTIAIGADTHSGDLAEVHLRDAMALQANGQTYHPIEASSLAGHHAEGSVTFELPNMPDRFAMTITSVR